MYWSRFIYDLTRTNYSQKNNLTFSYCPPAPPLSPGPLPSPVPEISITYLALRLQVNCAILMGSQLEHESFHICSAATDISLLINLSIWEELKPFGYYRLITIGLKAALKSDSITFRRPLPIQTWLTSQPI